MLIKNRKERFRTATSMWWRDPCLRPDETPSAWTLQQNNKQQHTKWKLEENHSNVLITRKCFQQLHPVVFSTPFRSMLFFSAPDVWPRLTRKDRREKSTCKAAHYLSVFKVEYQFVLFPPFLFTKPSRRNTSPQGHLRQGKPTFPISSCAFG